MFSDIKKLLKDLINSLEKQTIEIFTETKDLIKNKEDILIWTLLLFLVSIFTIFFIFFYFFFYLSYLFKFFYKNVKIKIKISKKEIIRVEKNIIEIKKNVYLILIKQIIWDQANMKSFLVLYSQLEIIKIFKKKIELKEISIFLVEKIIFRIVFVNITRFPLIVIKNVNFIFKIFKDIFIFEETPFFIKIKTLIYSIIIKYNINLAFKTKKSRIIILRKEIVLDVKDKDL